MAGWLLFFLVVNVSGTVGRGARSRRARKRPRICVATPHRLSKKRAPWTLAPLLPERLGTCAGHHQSPMVRFVTDIRLVCASAAGEWPFGRTQVDFPSKVRGAGQ